MSEHKGNDTKAIQHLSRETDKAMEAKGKHALPWIDGPCKEMRARVEEYTKAGVDITDDLLAEVLQLEFKDPDA